MRLLSIAFAALVLAACSSTLSVSSSSDSAPTTIQVSEAITVADWLAHNPELDRDIEAAAREAWLGLLDRPATGKLYVKYVAALKGVVFSLRDEPRWVKANQPQRLEAVRLWGTMILLGWDAVRRDPDERSA